MNTGINLTLMTHAYETKDVPVKVQIFDSDLKIVESRWLRARETYLFEVKPGVYGVRASLASGFVSDQTVRVKPDKVETCDIDLHEFSPHEEHEWAYFTQPIDSPGHKFLSDKTFEGVWMRMWQRGENGLWSTMPVPVHEASQASWKEDGVIYRFQTPSQGLYAIQVGGPRVQWKNVALPSSHTIMVLVRPATGPGSAVHPLDVVVSSDNLQMESLLSLLQRGDLRSARSLVEQLDLAEQFLYNKMEDADAAAVGGYFLLRMRDLVRLHQWASNLANWFEWMADGAVIHAWQLILENRQDASSSSHLEPARQRLLEAADRGFPVYSEGLQLLRDGLLYFDNKAKGGDTEILKALDIVAAYMAAADLSATTTTFTGVRPDLPDVKSRKGTPREKDQLIYVFDVPISELLHRTDIDPDETLVANLEEGQQQGTIKENGQFSLADGSSFSSVGAAQKSITGDTRSAWGQWHSVEKKQSLDQIAEKLRTQPKK